MKNRTNRHWIAFIFLVLLSGLILSGCGGGQPKTEEPARAPDEHTALYLGTWTADVIQMKTKNEKEFHDLKQPFSLRLDSSMAGELTIGETTQKITWELAASPSTPERALVTLTETFPLAGLVCDPQNFYAQITETDGSLSIDFTWSSKTEHGVNISIKTTLQKQ